MNQPGDLQILHEVVCKEYSQFRANGGRANSPYLPFFWKFSSAIEAARESGVKVSPTMVVMRPDGSHGVIDLVELFTELGYME